MLRSNVVAWSQRLLAQEKGLLADSDIEEDYEIELQEKDDKTWGD